MRALTHRTMKSTSLRTWVFNPFIHIAGFPAMLSGLAIMAATSVIAFFGKVHFDGAIDMHVGAVTPAWLYGVEPLLAWLIVSFVLYITASILSKSKIRLIDFFGTMALARAALLPGASILLLPSFQNLTPENMTPGMVLASLLLLIPIVWFITLLYNAFTLSANLKGNKAVWGFIVGLIAAEVISKIALHYLFTLYLK